jgi:hypothetical protein
MLLFLKDISTTGNPKEPLKEGHHVFFKANSQNLKSDIGGNISGR